MPEPSHSPTDRWLTAPRFAIGLALLIAFLFPAVVSGEKAFVFRDFGIFTCPNAAFQRDCFWQGELPLWNPFNNCGIPFLAQWNMAALYPLSLIYLLLPLIPGLSLFCLGHLLLAGLGMYFLALNWTQNRLAAAVAGTAFAFNGILLNCLMDTGNLAGLAWMPWVVLAMELAWSHGGRRVVIAALVGTLQMLSGAPEIIVFTWLILSGLLVLKLAASPGTRCRVLTRAALAAGFVGLLSAAQLLPFLDLLGHSERNSGYSTGDWAVPAWGWANLVLPLYHCYKAPLGVYFQPGQDWTSSYYPGIGILALAVLALFLAPRPKPLLFAGLAALGFWLALGKAGLLYTALGKTVPVLGFMRYPVKFVILLNFAAPLLAAHAVAALRQPEPVAPARKVAWLTGGIMSLFLIVVGALLWHAQRHPFPQEQWPALWHNGLLRLAFLLLIPGLAWLCRARPIPAAGWLLPLLVWADLATLGPSQNPVIDPAVYQPGLLAQRLDPLPRLGESRAMVLQPVHDLFYHRELDDLKTDFVGRRCSLMGDCNLLDKVPVPDGFYPLHLRGQELLYDEFSRSSPTNIAAAGFADFLAVADISKPDHLLEWESRPSHLPFYSVGARPEFIELSATPARLLSPEFDPRKTVFLPPAARESVTVTNAVQASVLRARFGNQHDEFEVHAEAPTLLVLSQTFYHPWHATVNGRPAEIWRANYAFQAVEIPGGTSRVEFTYHDRLFEIGALVSLTTLLACLATLLARRPVKP